MESGVCYSYSLLCNNKGPYLVDRAYTGSMQNQHQQTSTVSNVTDVEHSAKESLIRRHNDHTER